MRRAQWLRRRETIREVQCGESLPFIHAVRYQVPSRQFVIVKPFYAKHAAIVYPFRNRSKTNAFLCSYIALMNHNSSSPVARCCVNQGTVVRILLKVGLF